MFKSRFTKSKKKKKAPSDAERRRMLYQQLWIGLGIVLVLGSLVTAIWYGTRVEKWQIVTVEVTGGQTISHQLVQEKVNLLLEGTYYHLVPRSFSYLYPEEAIAADLQTIPRLRGVEIERPDPRTLKVSFTEYEPYALWCDQNNEDCMFIDEVGYAFTKAPSLSGSALVRYYTPEREFAVKQNPFSPAQFADTKKIVHGLEKEASLAVAKVVMYDRFDTSYFLTSGAEIKTSSRLAASESLANLKTVLASESFTGLTTGNFNYIDLRFGDKVFVSEEEVVATAKASSSIEIVE